MIKRIYLIISVIIITLASCSTTETKQLPVSSKNNNASLQQNTPPESNTSSEFNISESNGSIEQKAQQILKQMSDVLSSAPSYSFNALTIKEQVLPSGLKLQYDATVLVKLLRPNALFVDQISGAKKKTLWYHNTHLTLLDRKNNFYATTLTPDNTEDTLDFIMESFGVNMPLSDFVFKDLYSNLIENVLSGFYVAEVEVNGTKTHHLAFHQENVDWQIWINAEGQPVPKKFVITYNNKTSVPQFIAFFKDWNLTPRFKTNEFIFQRPKDAVEIEFYSKTKP